MPSKKEERRLKIRRRIRKTVSGTASRPRLSVYRSNNEIYAQLINDDLGNTLAAASSREISNKGTRVEVSKQVGKSLADKAKASGIEAVVFDRAGYLYHGRVKSLAEGAREGGLKF